MLRRMTLLRNKKGFTMIEMIAVLIIIAILVVATLPVMIGFINDARNKAVAASARTVYTACQKIATEIIGNGGDANTSGVFPRGRDKLDWGTAIDEYVTDIDIRPASITVRFEDPNEKGKVTSITYEQKDGGKTVFFDPTNGEIKVS
ncbi:MAG: prepilin-type N-terminal cleavage/methylation domain-containing protein [Oscillospiraceae bacterium]|nr:prepilin-type N-terminal cleavage/methylation domain-containing protein [Oscillospiraceae bacterium]